MKRRNIIKGFGFLPFAGSILGSVFFNSAQATPVKRKSRRNLLQELGIRTFINAAGTYTAMTASLMHKEVIETIEESAENFCMLEEVQDKVGEKIAQIVHAESAMVTSGAFAALTLGMAGILTGTDVEKIKQLPQRLEESGMRSEVLIQKSHFMAYEHALYNTGVKLIPVETSEDVDRLANEKTAAMFFLNTWASRGKIQHEEWLQLAKEHDLPTIIDIAADVPPMENLWKYNDMGFSLVVLSGGKGLRGPQSTGLLMGKKELIEAARLNNSPNAITIGRGMKVNKEEILGLYVALEKYIHEDHNREWKMWEDRTKTIYDAIKNIDGVSPTVFVPDSPNLHTPTVSIVWDKNKVRITAEEIMARLRNGSPSVEVIKNDNDGFNATVFMLKQGEASIVAKRIKEEFSRLI